jgi:hypothetical protein
MIFSSTNESLPVAKYFLLNKIIGILLPSERERERERFIPSDGVYIQKIQTKIHW